MVAEPLVLATSVRNDQKSKFAIITTTFSGHRLKLKVHSLSFLNLKGEKVVILKLSFSGDEVEEKGGEERLSMKRHQLTVLFAAAKVDAIRHRPRRGHR